MITTTIDPEISQEGLKRRLVLFARELGFDSCRVATCGFPPHADEFRNWLRNEAYGEMHYMERAEEKRCDPQKVLPGAQAIVVLAMNYFHKEEKKDDTPAARGRIARYAWGDDYHVVIE